MDRGPPKRVCTRPDRRCLSRYTVPELLEDRLCLNSSPSSVAVSEFPSGASSSPYSITTGPDNALWFTDATDNAIGRIDPSSHQISEYTLPTQQFAGLRGITVGPDGAIRFTEYNSERIGWIDPFSHQITEYVIPTFTAQNGGGLIATHGPTAITSGSDGALWFTEYLGHSIGRIDPFSHQITQYYIGPGFNTPTGITSGADGAPWFTNPLGVRVGRIDPSSKVITQYPATVADAITSGPDGAIWFTTHGGVGEIDPISLATNYYSTPVQFDDGSSSTGIAIGSDGAVWFTEWGSASDGFSSGSFILRIDPNSYQMNVFSIPSSFNEAYGITSGPDGALWFTEQGLPDSNIGRLSFDAPPSIPPLDDPASESPEDLAPIAFDPVITAATTTDDSISNAQVRYSDGVVRLDTTDLQSFGFGTPWGQSRSWTNGPGYASRTNNGDGMVDLNLPYLIQVFDNYTIAVVMSGTNARYFDGLGNPSGNDLNYTERFDGKETLVQDPSTGDFLLTDTAGDILDFYAFDSSLPGPEQGQLKTFTDAAGNVTDLSDRTSDGKVAEVMRSSTIDSTTVTEAFVYQYIPSGGSARGCCRMSLCRDRPTAVHRPRCVRSSMTTTMAPAPMETWATLRQRRSKTPPTTSSMKTTTATTSLMRPTATLMA